MNRNPSLDDEISKLLKRQVRNWAALFALLNIPVIVGSLVYVFFFLPKKASEEARVLLQSENTKQIDPLKDTIGQLTLKAGIITEQLRASTDAAKRLLQEQTEIEKTFKDLQSRIGALHVQLQGMEKSNPALAAQFVQEFNQHPDIKSWVTRIQTLEQNAIKSGDAVRLRTPTTPSRSLVDLGDKHFNVQIQDKRDSSYTPQNWIIEPAP